MELKRNLMGDIREAPCAHPFYAVMFADKKGYDDVLSEIVNKHGEILSSGEIYDFSSFTDYYEKEYGTNLRKQFIAFRNPVKLDNYFSIKVWTNELEKEISSKYKPSGSRIVNIDPGYLEPSKLVLYSTKNYSHRVYTGKGVFAEVTLIYEHGRFKALPWTYPDYLWEKNLDFLAHVRDNIVDIARRPY